MNPYNWQRDNPAVEVPRPHAKSVLKNLLRGGSAVVMAGRGMGKTVFLRQVERVASEMENVRVLRLPSPPPELNYPSCLNALADGLGMSRDGLDNSNALVKKYFQENRGAIDQLVLLYDEFDRYAQDAMKSPGGRGFFTDLETTRKENPVGILAAGNIGTFVFRDVLGSPFLSRADQVFLDPFTQEDLEILVQPFVDQGEPLSGDVLELLLLLSGGNPALTTYGLEMLWEEEQRSQETVSRAFSKFDEKNRRFLESFERSFADESLSAAPQRVLDLVLKKGSPLERSELRGACQGGGGVLDLDYRDVVDLLRAAGLVRLVGSVNAELRQACPRGVPTNPRYRGFRATDSPTECRQSWRQRVRLRSKSLQGSAERQRPRSWRPKRTVDAYRYN